MDPIEAIQRRCAETPGVLSLAGGLPDVSLAPIGALARASARALARGATEALQYGWAEGQLALREWIARRLTNELVPTQASDVIVTAGAQQAIAIAMDVLRKEALDPRIAMDAETYPGAIDLAHARHLVVTQNPRVADFAYVIDGIGNPHGRPLSAARRERLASSRCPLIVDRVYADLRFDGQTAPPVLREERERLWIVGSFSKTLSPGLRVGWLVPPRAHHDEALALKHDADLQASGLSQAILVELFRQFDFSAHLDRSRASYARRASRLMDALRRHLPDWRFSEPEGGFSIFVEAPSGVDDRELLVHAAREGVSFDPGRMFRVDDASQPLAMRLSFSNIAESSIDDAVQRLARARRIARAA